MYGRQLLNNNIVFPTHVSFDGRPKYKAGGITLDLTTLTAASGTDTTLVDGSIIRANNQFLRYGQVLTKITGATDTLNTSGVPTGGTFTLDVITGNGVKQTTAAIAFNASAANVATAIGALSNIGAANVAASGGALTTTPVTLTFASTLGTVTMALNNNSLTGGASPSVVIGASLSTGSTVGWFGPYDPAASDGRAVLTRGECFVLDETWLLTPGGSVLAPSNNIMGNVIEGGDIWLGRVIQSGTAAHSLAAGPTLAEFLAAFPLFSLVKN